MLSPKAKTAARWGLGLGLLVFIAAQLSLRSLQELLVTMALAPLLLSLLAKFSVRLLVGFKWYLLVRVRDPGFRLTDALAMHFIGGAAGIALPTFGVDAVIGYTYYRSGGKAGTAISTMLADRLISTYVVIFLAAAGVLANLERFAAMPGLVEFVGLLVAGAIAGPFVLWWIATHPVLHRRLRLPEKAVWLAKEILHGLKDLKRHGVGMMAMNVLIALASLFMRVIGTYLLAVALHEQPSLLDFIVLTPLTFLISMLPLTVGGLGVEQGAFIVLFGLVGISQESAFVMSIVGAALTTVTVLPGVVLIMRGWRGAPREVPGPSGTVP